MKYITLTKNAFPDLLIWGLNPELNKHIKNKYDQSHLMVHVISELVRLLHAYLNNYVYQTIYPWQCAINNG